MRESKILISFRGYSKLTSRGAIDGHQSDCRRPRHGPQGCRNTHVDERDGVSHHKDIPSTDRKELRIQIPYARPAGAGLVLEPTDLGNLR
jgi:hypothetical protein